MERLVSAQYLPTGRFRPEKVGLVPDNQIVEKFHQVSTILAGLGLEHRIHYFFGRYQGKSSSGKDNRNRAVYMREGGVEDWRPMKSIAYTTPTAELVIAHLRQDRRVNTEMLAKALAVNPQELSLANLGKFNLLYGTVNPFIEEVEGFVEPGVLGKTKVTHIFDSDLVAGPDYPKDDFILTSSGDHRMYVELDIRSYLQAAYKMDPEKTTFAISQTSPESQRIFPRSLIRVIGGDNARDPDKLTIRLKERAIQRLKGAGAFYGDRSELPTVSEAVPALARTINTDLYDSWLQRYIARKAAEHRTDNETWILSSTAGDGTMGETLRQAEGINYLGRKEPLERFLKGLQAHNIRVAQVVLLGLSSVYDPHTSAFAGEVLKGAVPVSMETRMTLERLIQECKTTSPDPSRYYQIIESILRKHLRGDFNQLIGENPDKPAVVVVNGASELEELVAQKHKVPGLWAVIRSTEPPFISTSLEKPYFSKELSQRRRLILYSPTEALVDQAISESLGLD